MASSFIVAISYPEPSLSGSGYEIVVVANNDVTEESKTSSENSNTRKSTNVLVGVFKKWAALRNIGEDMETYETHMRFKNLTSSQLTSE